MPCSREMFRAQLLEHFDDLKGTLYYAEGEKDMYSYLKNWLEQKEYYPQILEYYGEYNGVSVLYVEIGFNMFMISEEYCVGEYTFYPWHIVLSCMDESRGNRIFAAGNDVIKSKRRVEMLWRKRHRVRRRIPPRPHSVTIFTKSSANSIIFGGNML